MGVRVEFFHADSRRGRVERKKILNAKNSTTTKSYYEFGLDYFDGPASQIGYGGYAYDGRHEGACATIINHFGLRSGARILDFGCAKGFLVTEFRKLGMDAWGLDVSEYAINNAEPETLPFLQLAPAYLPAFPQPLFEEHWDLVITKDVIPHLPLSEVEALFEHLNGNRIPTFASIQCVQDSESKNLLQKWDPTTKIVWTSAEWEVWLGKYSEIHYELTELF